MKNWILFIGLGLFAFAGNGYAQTCSHGSKTAEVNSCVKPSKAALKAAMKAASLDPSIETKTCKDKSICFVKKTTDAQGMVSTEPVMYDEAKAQFVSITADSKTGKACSASKACCAKGAGKACCKSKASASVAPTEGATSTQALPAEGPAANDVIKTK